MAIIYQPQEVFNVRNAVGGAIQSAALRAAVEFVAGTNKPWSYYLGIGFGTAALATGIPGAAATIYVIGDTLDFYVFKSPSGSELRLFLNGVQQTTIDTFALTTAWELVQGIVLGSGQRNELTFVNYAASTASGATGIPWLAINDITVNGSNAFAEPARGENMVYDIVSFSVRDGEESSPPASFPIYIPTGFSVATLQAFANMAAVRLDRVSGGRIISAQVTLGLNLPTASATPGATEIKNAPTANIMNERGGLISFDTAGPRNESIWIPAMNTTIMPGSVFNLTQTDVAALVTLFRDGVTANSEAVRPVSPHNYQFTAALSTRKSLRR